MRGLALLVVAGCAPSRGVTLADTPGTETGESTGDPGGTGDPTVPPTTTTPDPWTAVTDFDLPGPYATTATDDTFPAPSCDLGITSYLPTGTPPVALVLLLHGFQRDRTKMAAWAEHWASYGLAVVAPDLCHSNVFDTDPELNATDVLALADALGQGGPTAYVGHSNGGLVAFLAVHDDPNAVAYLGFDPVDVSDLGLSVAPSQTVPAWALFGEPVFCSSDSNGVPWFDAVGGGRALRIDGAGHCDFEDPTDWLCSLACGDGTAPIDQTHDIIRTMSTAFLAWQLGIDPTGEAWWTPGTPEYDWIATATTEL